MALVLIKEDGTGKVDANSYASAAEGDAYFEGHLYATVWTSATTGNKEAALVFATRLVDAEFQFYGFKTTTAQALQWPRQKCPDPDAEPGQDGIFSNNAVPKVIVQATCEMARELLILDRTTSPPGEGLKYFNDGTTQTGYGKGDTRQVITHVAQSLLGKFGTMLKSKSGAVRLVRS